LSEKLNVKNPTFPQIFIGDTAIGGCDELYELEKSNKLDELLKEYKG
jgi:glutaredoxin 3